MSGAAHPYPIRVKEGILRDILCIYKRYRKKTPDAGMDGFLKANGELFNFYWYDLVRNPTKIKLVTTDGEQVVVSRAYYHFEDKGPILESLRKIEEFEEERVNLPGLGSETKKGRRNCWEEFSLTETPLVLECSSRERLKRGKETSRSVSPGLGTR